MWLLITIISMLLLAVSEIIGKIIVSADKEFNILKLRISAILVDAVMLLFLWIFYYRGTSTNPLLIVLEYPQIIIVASLNVLEIFLFLKALKHIGLTIQEAYSGTSSVLLFIGMILINLVYGKIADIRTMLIPSKLIIIVIMILASFILPRLNGSAKETLEISKTNKRNMLLGLLLSLAAYVFDATESLILIYTFAESDISSIDYISSGFLVTLFWGVIFYAILRFKSRKVFNPFKKGNIIYTIYGVFNALYIILYFYGASLAPIQSNIFWFAYPIIPIICSAVFLKERYSFKQYICIAVTAISSMAFGIMDYIA